ncbi:hypothetical protein HAX54_031881, partial [Datura stramonium]|nr:hypothetical protein [Datura stramonium]
DGIVAAPSIGGGRRACRREEDERGRCGGCPARGKKRERSGCCGAVGGSGWHQWRRWERIGMCHRSFTDFTGEIQQRRLDAGWRERKKNEGDQRVICAAVVKEKNECDWVW